MTTEGGGIDEALIGGNASAEGGAEELEEGSVSGCNIVLANKLEETSFGSKKDYQTEIKVCKCILFCVMLLYETVGIFKEAIRAPEGEGC